MTMRRFISGSIFVCAFGLVGGVDAGATTAELAPATVPSEILEQVEMNPRYVAVCSAIVRDDQRSLYEFAKTLDALGQEKPALRIPSLCTCMYIAENLREQSVYRSAFVELCRKAAPDASGAKHRLAFIKRSIERLRRDKRSQWVADSTGAALAVLGSEPDELLVYLVQERVRQVVQYPDKAKILSEILPKSRKAWEGCPDGSPNKTKFRLGVEQLCFLAVETHYNALKVEPLWTEVFAYLERFGAEGRFAQPIFCRMVQALNVARTLKLPGLKLTAEQRQLLESWREKVLATGESKWTARISGEWDKWRKSE